MERCEEVVLIDAYLKVRDRMQATDRTRTDFEFYFFEKGQGISSQTIDGLNLELRRASLPPLKFCETVIFDYGRNADRAWKARERGKIKTELEEASDEARTTMVAYAQAEAARLSPPHRTWEEYREDRERQEEENRLARETAYRDAARQRLLNPAPSKPLAPDLAAALLVATDDETLQDEIIARVAGDQIVALIEKLTDQSLRNKVVRRALTQL
jgi:hypothetical protein